MATIWERLRAFVAPPVRPADDEAAARFGAVSDSWTGIAVTPTGALNISAVYASVRAVADAMASLPLVMYERQGRNKVRAEGHPTYAVLKEQANRWMTAYEYRQVKYAHLLLWGNHFAEIEHDSNGRVIGLFPLRPDRVQMHIVEGDPVYEVIVPGLPNVMLPRWRVHHVKGLGTSGWLGYSPIALGANAMGLALAAEEYGGRFFGSGGRPSGVLKHPGQLGDEAYERLRESWNAAGLTHAHKTKILEEGMEYETIGVPPEEAQFLQTRQFQLTEVARWFRVPPVLIGDLVRATYTNAEQQMIDFVQNCLRPWASNDEQALHRDVLIGGDKQRFDIEYLFADLLRGDTAARYAAYQIAVTHGISTINEARAAENLPPVANGDELYMPLQVGRVLADGGIEAPTQAEEPGNGEQMAVERPEEPDTFVQRILETTRERRALDGLNQRAMVAQAYIEPLLEVLGRTVRKEVRDIRKELGKIAIGGSIEDFFAWLKEYERELAPYMRRSLGPVLRTMMLQVAGIASAEVGQPSPGLTEALQAWVDGYTERYGAEYGDESYNQLRALYAATLEDGGAAEEALGQRLTEWEEKRPGKEARSESVNFASAAAIAVWEGYRVERIRVRANAGACGFCRRLDGRVVGIRESIIRKGDELEGDDGARMTISRDRKHPPFHGECSCGITAEVG
jgi:HK97 family phage portal protein